MTLTIDLHKHVLPSFYWDASNEDGTAAGGINPPRWSLEGAIAYLDEAGIDVAVPSISTPGVHFGEDAGGRTRGLRGAAAAGRRRVAGTARLRVRRAQARRGLSDDQRRRELPGRRALRCRL